MPNRLASESSPYLLQHARNPVDWYPWSAEALQRAQEEDRPIFLSIGYSACHWCHVMEHESFEDPELTMAGRFPTSPNHWQGRVFSVPERQELSAVRGTRVGKFIGGGTTKFTYARYIIDLDEHPKVNTDRVRSVEVEASFATSNPKESSAFQIRLGLLSQEPEEVRPIWNDHELLFDTVLGHVGRNYTTVPGDQTGWHKLRATIEVPPGTRSIVISLGAGNDEPGPTTSDHFVDAVRVRLVDTIGQGD